MNSGSLKVSVSSRMYELSFYFKCILILANMSYSIKILLKRGYMLYVGSYCGSLRGAWRTIGSNGSDNRACLSSKVYGLSWKELRVIVWGFWVFVGVVGYGIPMDMP